MRRCALLCVRILYGRLVCSHGLSLSPRGRGALPPWCVPALWVVDYWYSGDMARQKEVTRMVLDASGLPNEQKTTLILENLAAGFGTRATGRMLNLSSSMVDRVKHKLADELADLRDDFKKNALREGFARRETRVSKLNETLITLEAKKFELDDYGSPRWYHLWLKTVSELGKLMGDYDITVRHQLSPQLAEVVEALGARQTQMIVDAQVKVLPDNAPSSL